MEAKSGDVVDAFEVGPLRVTVRYGCVRRDQYELVTTGPVSATLRARLAAQAGAVVSGAEALFVVDVPAIHQITVAAARGRIVVMPRLRRTRPEQRDAVLALCALVADAQREAGQA